MPKRQNFLTFLYDLKYKTVQSCLIFLRNINFLKKELKNEFTIFLTFQSIF